MAKEPKYKVLITGGAGFIGSYLTRVLLEHGHMVLCLDNLSTGKLENIEEIEDDPNFIFHQGDIRDAEICRRAASGVDYVVHLAALGSVPRSFKDPETTKAVNVEGFKNVIEATRLAGIKRFIYASSSSVYGDSKELPKVEDKIGKPLSPYAETKLENEKIAAQYAKDFGMECAGLRFFNVFGPRQDPQSEYAAVIPLWAKLFLEGRSPVINGKGEYSRDFTYVDNAVSAIINAMFVPTENLITLGDKQDVANQVFNVAGGAQTTLLELFNTMRGSLAEFKPSIEKIEPTFGPYREGDIPHSLASIDKAVEFLEYEPEWSAQEGIELVCEWYTENL